MPTAQANYDGWIEFGGQYNTRTAIHEIAHALGTGTYRQLTGGPWAEDSAAGRLEKLYDGQAAVLSTGGSHFWPYGLNYDNEDGPAARERHVKITSALRFDFGIVVDSDKDGLPDDWETFHFQSLMQTAKGDPDADSISNLDEYNTDSDPNTACPVRDGQSYVIRVQLADRLLTVESSKVVLRAAADRPGQRWTAHYAGAGYWRFSGEGSDKVLEVPGTDTGSGRALQLATQTDSLQQQWRITDGPGAAIDHWQLANRETGRVADALDGVEGAQLQQWPMLGNLPQQYFAFEGMNSPPDAGAANDAGSKDAGDAGAAAGGDAGAAPDAGRAVSKDAGSAGKLDAAAPLDASDGPEPEAEPTTRTRDSGGCSLQGTQDRGAFAGFATLALGLAAIRRRRRHGR